MAHSGGAGQIFASHAIGGIIGNVLTGLFAQASVAGFDAIADIPGGWLDHHYIQLGYQLADSVSGMSYSFVLTTAILWIMHFIPGLRLRSSEEAEILGIDDTEMGEFAYDYVGLDFVTSGANGVSASEGGGARQNGGGGGLRSDLTERPPKSELTLSGCGADAGSGSGEGAYPLPLCEREGVY